MFRYGATTLQANTWYHVTGVYDAATAQLHVYLNGQLDDGALLGTVTSSQQNSSVNVNIGRRPTGNGFNTNGRIDDVRIYGRALTLAEIQADMNTAVAGGGGGGDLIPPTAPTNSTATAASSTQIDLSWSPATDNVLVTGYRVERCQGAGCSVFAEIAQPAGTTFSDTGRSASTSYSYRVRAIDAAGNLGPYSGTATATTPAAPAPGPTAAAAYAFNEATGRRPPTPPATGSPARSRTARPGARAVTPARSPWTASTTSSISVTRRLLQLTGSMTVSAWVNSSAFPVDDAAIVSKRAAARSASAGHDDRQRAAHDRLQAHEQLGRRHVPLRGDDAAGQHLVPRHRASTTRRPASCTCTSTASSTTARWSARSPRRSRTRPSTSTSASARQAGFNFNGRIDDVRIYSTGADAGRDPDGHEHAGRRARRRRPDTADGRDHLAREQRAGGRHRERHRGRERQHRCRRCAVPRRRRRRRRRGCQPLPTRWPGIRARSSNGAHTLTARARDAAGNSTLSAAVPVNVANSSSFQNEILATGLQPPDEHDVPSRRPACSSSSCRARSRCCPPPYTQREPDAVPAADERRAARPGCSRASFDIALDPNFATNHYYYVFYTPERRTGPALALHRQRDAHRHGRQAARSSSTRIRRTPTPSITAARSCSATTERSTSPPGDHFHGTPSQIADEPAREDPPHQPGRHGSDRQPVLRRRRAERRLDLGARPAQPVPRLLRRSDRAGCTSATSAATTLAPPRRRSTSARAARTTAGRTRRHCPATPARARSTRTRTTAAMRPITGGFVYHGTQFPS